MCSLHELEHFPMIVNVLSLPISDFQWLNFVKKIKKKKDADQRMRVICPDEMLYCLFLSNLRSLINENKRSYRRKDV